MTITLGLIQQFAKNQAWQGKIFFSNVGIMSISKLIFAAKEGYFSTPDTRFQLYES